MTRRPVASILGHDAQNSTLISLDLVVYCLNIEANPQTTTKICMLILYATRLQVYNIQPAEKQLCPSAWSIRVAGGRQYKAEAMRHTTDLSNGFWKLSCEAAVHINNCLPTTRLKWHTSIEKFLREKPDISDFCLFECKAYILTQKEHRQGKLALKAIVMTFVGYEPGSKGYRFWDKITRQIVISRDVKFDKQSFPYCKDISPATNTTNDDNTTPPLDNDSTLVSNDDDTSDPDDEDENHPDQLPHQSALPKPDCPDGKQEHDQKPQAPAAKAPSACCIPKPKSREPGATQPI